jgi:hypothetical protein
MKIKIEIDTEEEKASRALFNVYVDMKKKELTKNQIPATMTKTDCDCKLDTYYKASVVK